MQTEHDCEISTCSSGLVIIIAISYRICMQDDIINKYLKMLAYCNIDSLKIFTSYIDSL